MIRLANDRLATDGKRLGVPHAPGLRVGVFSLFSSGCSAPRTRRATPLGLSNISDQARLLMLRSTFSKSH